MAKRKKPRVAPPPVPDERPALSRRALAAGALALIVAGVAAFLLVGSGGEPETTLTSDPEDLAVPWVDPDGVTPVVGSIDVNPADDSVWFSTNTGMWRVPPGGGAPEQVTGTLESEEISPELVIRFRGADSLIASGHPPAESSLPDALGLIESADAGATWSEISGLGQTDYHAIQLSGDTIVAGVFQAPAVSVSTDGGETFEERRTPEPLVDLEVDPEDPGRLVASTQQSVIGSADGGATWRERDRIPNVRFTWPEPGALYRIDPGGAVKLSADGGETWEDRGTTGGEPQAVYADTADHLLVARLDGTIRESADGGRTWTDLLTP